MFFSTFFVTRLFRRIFSRVQQQQQTNHPPLGEPLPPPVGGSAPPTSSNFPRGGPMVTAREPAVPRVIQQMPTEQAPRGVRPTLRVDRGIQKNIDAPELLDQGVQVGAEVPNYIDQGLQAVPEMIDRGTNTRGPIVPPRAVPIPIPWGSGGGRKPPRQGGRKFFGGGDGFFSADLSEWVFLFIGLFTTLALYQFFLGRIREKTNLALDQLEATQKEKAAYSEESRIAFWRDKGWMLFKQSWVFLGSVLAGRPVLARAVRLIVLPPLRRAIRAVVPPVVRGVVGPVVGVVADVGLRAIPPISRFLSFIFGIDLLRRLVFAINPQWAATFEPIFGSVHFMIQRFFATPKGVSFVSGFLERTFKVVGGSFLFGGFYLQFLVIFEEGDRARRLKALGISSFLGVALFLVFNDHRFICFFVQNVLQKFPSLNIQLQQPLNQTCLLFASGILLKSAFGAYSVTSNKTFIKGVPTVITFFYAWALYCSGLHYYILTINLPFLASRDQK